MTPGRSGTIFSQRSSYFWYDSTFAEKEFLEPDVLGMEDRNKRLALSSDEPETMHSTGLGVTEPFVT